MPTLLLTAFLSLLGPNDDWPCWRGATRDGVARALPWSADEPPSVAWTAEIGRGYSCPSIAGETVFTLGFDEARSRDVVRALSLASGEELWSFDYPAELRDRDHGGGTLTTPAVSGGRVYVTSRFGVAGCLDAGTGEVLWQRNLIEDEGVPDDYYGYASSPVVIDGRVYFAFDRAFALDAGTGATIWATPSLEANWSTPTPRFDADSGALDALLVFSQRGLHVLAPAGGEETHFFEWHKSDRLVNASTPILVGEDVFVSSAYDHGCALVDLDGEDGAPAAVWARRTLRTKMAGCVLVAGHVFGFDESMLTCVDVANGETRWRVRGLGNGAVVAAGDALLVTTSKGELIVADATGERFVERSRTRIFDDGGVYWSPPVVANGRVFVRSSAGRLAALVGGATSAAVHDEPEASAASDDALPSAASLFRRHLDAIGGAGALAERASLTRTGTFDMNSVGFAATSLEVWQAAPNLHRARFGLPAPRDGHIERMYDGEHAYEVNAYLGHTLYDADVRREMRDCMTPWSALAWSDRHPDAVTREVVTFAERPCYRVTASLDATHARSYYFDVETGLCRGRDGDGEALVIYDAYREFDGLLLPTVERFFTMDTGIEEVFRTESVAFSPLAPDRFERPAEIQELVEATSEQEDGR